MVSPIAPLLALTRLWLTGHIFEPDKTILRFLLLLTSWLGKKDEFERNGWGFDQWVETDQVIEIVMWTP